MSKISGSGRTTKPDISYRVLLYNLPKIGAKMANKKPLMGFTCYTYILDLRGIL
jgi:hypothetical protein